MPRVFDHLVKSAIRLERQSTTVPNTSNTSAFTAEISDMFASNPFSCTTYSGHSGMRHLAQARNPYSDASMDSGFALRAPRNDDLQHLSVLNEAEIVGNLVIERARRRVAG